MQRRVSHKYVTEMMSETVNQGKTNKLDKQT